MIAYEIRPPSSKVAQPLLTAKERSILHLPPEPIGKRQKAKKEIFDREFNDLYFNVGDEVQFKNSHRNRQKWRICEIDLDWESCKWTKGGKLPLFIKLERTVTHAGNKVRVEHCYTSTSALEQPAGKGKWQT